MAPGTTQLQPSESEWTVSCVSSQVYVQRETMEHPVGAQGGQEVHWKAAGGIVVKEHSSPEAVSRGQLHDR